MKPKRGRGRPKGTKKEFASDPDRYLLALVDALLAVNPGTRFEVAATLAIYLHKGEQTALPADPLKSARRLALRGEVQRMLREAWVLQQFGPEDRRDIGGQIDRLRKKSRRVADDPTAQRWRDCMQLAWVCLLTAPSFEVVEAATREAGESAYFEAVMLPFVKKIAGVN